MSKKPFQTRLILASVFCLIGWSLSEAQQRPSNRNLPLPADLDAKAFLPAANAGNFSATALSIQAGPLYPSEALKSSQQSPQSSEAISQTASQLAYRTPPSDLQSLMRPVINLNSEWITASDFDLSTYDLRVTVPTYPFFGPPPPMISVGIAYTSLADAANFDLPSDLFTYSAGLSWIRNLNERWKLRMTAGVALATDNQNTSSEAWQFRGGLFAIYEPNQRWQWVFGGLALGRRDLPFVPAIGAIWQPNPLVKYDLTLPRPKVSYLIGEGNSRQQWTYAGLELGGGTWGYETTTQANAQLTYGDWRAVIGWESVPAPIPHTPVTVGRRFGLEMGYVFARDLTRSGNAPELELSNAIIFGIDTRF